jgi:hypothetical protein
VGGKYRGQRGEQQAQQHRPCAQLDRALNTEFAGDASQRQVAEDQRAKYRDLQQAIV